jgi:hypothetical protein
MKTIYMTKYVYLSVQYLTARKKYRLKTTANMQIMMVVF